MIYSFRFLLCRSATDALIIQLERYSSTTSGQTNNVKFLERLEAVLAASGR